MSSNYLFQNNTIQLPSNWPATPQLPTTNKMSYGIFNTMRANTFNNVVNGEASTNSSVFNTITRIGAYNASPFVGFYDGNIFRNLHQGMRLKVFNNGTARLEKNLFENNVDAIRVANSGAGPSSMVTTMCNSFTNPAARANTSAIRVETEAFLNSLQNMGGGTAYPNGNAFSGMTKPIDFLGTNSSYNAFTYLRSTSAMENPPSPQISGPSTKNFTTASYAGGCTGTNGAKRVGIFEEALLSEYEVKEMLNQIRFRYISGQDQNAYLRKLITYYGTKHQMGELYQWQKLMNKFNKKAYASIALFLMDYFRAEGSEAQAQEVAQALLAANPQSKEIDARIKYFNLPATSVKSLTARAAASDDERGQILNELAYSGTSVADLACMLMRLENTSAPCPQPDSSSINARQGAWDSEVEDEKEIADSYLGYCFPNPVKEETVIYFFVPDEAGKGLLRITNTSTGAIVKEFAVSGKDYINLSVEDLAPGVYGYTLLVRDVPVATKKLVVVK